MAFDNSPTAGNINYAATETKRTNWFAIISIALIMALLITLGYSIWDNNKIKDTLQQKDNDYAGMLAQKDTLQSLLDDASMRYDLLKTINVKRDSTISSQEKEISKIRSLIQSMMATIKINQSEHAALRQLIESLNTNIEGYKKQIEIISGQNLEIAKANIAAAAAATEEKIKTEDALKVAPTAAAETNLNDYGSTLYATNFKNTGFEESRKGKLKKTRSARSVDLLRVSFDLQENHTTTSGNKDIYVAITSPDGSPLMVQALGSGKFTARDGKEKAYTQKVKIDYKQGVPQNVSFDWKQNSKFENGKYKIEVFNNGFKIGEGICNFKKSGVFD